MNFLSASFSGSDSNGVAVSGTEDVTLSAGTTLVVGGADKVLVDGDSETGSHGNELRFSASNALKTA